MTTTEKKWFNVPIEIKDDGQGQVEAVFATIGVVDHDRDVVRPGAIKAGADVLMSKFGHSIITAGGLPIGDGTTVIIGDKAIFRGQLWLEMQDARDSYAVLKRRGQKQQWSFGYAVLASEAPTEAEAKAGARRALTDLDTFEASPVFRGAGLNTQTLSVKEASVEPQADGDAPIAPTAEEIAEIVLAAEVKAAQDFIEAKAVADAETERKARESDTVRKELERMLRTMQRHAC